MQPGAGLSRAVGAPGAEDQECGAWRERKSEKAKSQFEKLGTPLTFSQSAEMFVEEAVGGEA